MTAAEGEPGLESRPKPITSHYNLFDKQMRGGIASFKAVKGLLTAFQRVVFISNFSGDGRVAALLQRRDELLRPVLPPLQTVQEQHHAVKVAISLPLCFYVLLQLD